MKRNRLIVISLVSLLMSGCSSLGKGVTEAFLEKQESEDTRVCEIWGQAFTGLDSHGLEHNGKVKVLMVHGVGEHQPGYSTEFYEKLAKELGLSVTSKTHKDIELSNKENSTNALGKLRINRYLTKDQSQEYLFYELTWSDITAKEKEVLAYDNSGEYSFRRAEVNDLMKRFSNDTGPDPIIYLGESRQSILSSFAQSVCWMTSGDWDDLPTDKRAICEKSNVDSINKDQYAFISHSLGSRITIDGMQYIAERLGHNQGKNKESVIALKEKIIPMYMMSNQLPMLQLGRKIPEVSNQKAQYCDEAGENYAERLLKKTPIIAFSDPNDLLSYAIPPRFVDKYLDSRLCIDVTNININVAFVYDVFGMGKMANPMDAHIGYDTDDRVVALIAKGMGGNNTANIVKERCRWIETIE